MAIFSIEQFDSKIDSLYRLVILTSRRATQLSKPETRPLVHPISKKVTITALQEVLEDKLTYRIEGEDEEAFGN